MKQKLLLLVCLTILKIVDAANVNVPKDKVKSTEWIGTQVQTSTTFNFVHNDQTGFVNQITWCQNTTHMAIENKARAQCWEGTNITSKFGEKVSNFSRNETIYCDVAKTSTEKTCINKVTPYFYTVSYATNYYGYYDYYQYLYDMQYSTINGTTGSVTGEYNDFFAIKGTQQDFGNGCLVGMSGEYYANNLVRVKFHYAEGWQYQQECEIPAGVLIIVAIVVSICVCIICCGGIIAFLKSRGVIKVGAEGGEAEDPKMNDAKKRVTQAKEASEMQNFQSLAQTSVIISTDVNIDQV